MSDIIPTKLKRAHLAKALGISNASVTMAIKNGTLHLNEDNLLDINDLRNKHWIDSQIVKGQTFDINRLVIKTKARNEQLKTKAKKPAKKTPQPEVNYDDDSGTPLEQMRALELKKKQLEVKRLEKGNKLDELKILKQQGQLVPYDAIKSVFLYSIETFRSTYIQEVISLANVFKQRLNASHSDFVEIQKDLEDRINTIQSEIKDNLLAGLKGIVSEYSEVRGRGERK